MLSSGAQTAAEIEKVAVHEQAEPSYLDLADRLDAFEHCVMGGVDRTVGVREQNSVRAGMGGRVEPDVVLFRPFRDRIDVRAAEFEAEQRCQIVLRRKQQLRIVPLRLLLDAFSDLPPAERDLLGGPDADE